MSANLAATDLTDLTALADRYQIGRASCRERVCLLV